MIELTGTLLERLEQAVRLVCTEVSQEEVDGFIALYRKAGVKLLPSAIEFFKQYGGAYRNSYIMLTDPKYNQEISLHCFDTITNFYYSYAFDPGESEKEALRQFDWAMDDLAQVKAFAGQEVCPIGMIGYYYPAYVYIGTDGRLYCVYDFKDEIEVFHTPAEILEGYLRNNISIGVDNMPIRTQYD